MPKLHFLLDAFTYTFENIPSISIMEISLNSEDGYTDIVPVNCNCMGYCSMNETDDTFGCFCPNDTQLAKDGFDCFSGKYTYI